MIEVRTSQITDVEDEFNKGVFANQLIKDKIVQGGMIPKVQCCVSAIANGVKAAHIIDGREPHSLLMEILTDIGCGTKIDA